ncbi:unnamed protein product [Spirodela intermedia]|uniref:Protein kinase domain-containing protein n=1 Tax=Spirodela intermedia TaxID=51605 RepID=A0ABN7EAZ0_SPIIN|nr:unnamed protein product [Spirodela intermedia]
MGWARAATLLCFLSLVAVAHWPVRLSIDCGSGGRLKLHRAVLGIIYSPDAGYVDDGVNVDIPRGPLYGVPRPEYLTMRSFPNGTRELLTMALRVLVRQLRWQEPAAQFDLYLGREPSSPSPRKGVQVCLVNTGMGTPFISVLEMRPLRDSCTLSSTNPNRWYPVDPYDRIWVRSETATVAESLTFEFLKRPTGELYVFMYFAELQRLGSNETREINVFSSGLNCGMGHTGRTSIMFDVTAQAMLKIKDFVQSEEELARGPGVSCGYDDSENPRVVSLNLVPQCIDGGIPLFIVELVALRTLDLSQNNLTGEIPSDLGKLPNLQVLNLANNQLTGFIPEILYNKSQNGKLSLSTEGNTKLCNKVDSCEIISGKKKNIVPITVGISVSAIFLLGIFIVVWRLKGRKRGTVRSAPHEIHVNNSGDNKGPQVKRQQHDFNMESHQFSISDIVNITRNFERVIGRGGFGIVYHGLLNEGREVAVKMISKSSQGEKEFHAEVQILLRVHHKNLVYLLGYCDDRNNLALVYEYMQKGSLADFLSGLDYLHSFCKPSIVHRDVKTGNILLNAKLEAKLGDFGLSKLFSHEDATHISTAVAGTPGYLDPEYYQTYRLTEKSDIYSFGIVLLEIISGKSPISRDPQSAPIVSWVQSRLERGDISSIADQRLNNGYDLNSIWKAAEVAMACASPTSSCRPKMSEVVALLKECLESIASHDISGSFSMERSNSNYTGPTVFYSSTIPSAR